MLLACSVQTATARDFISLGRNFLVTSIAHDTQNIYIATRNGLVVIDKETESQTLYNSENSSLPSLSPELGDKKEAIYSMVMHDGVLWLGRPFCSYSSFCDGVFTNYQKMIPEFKLWHNADEIGGWAVGSLAFDPDGELMYISEEDAFAPLLNGEFLPAYCFWTAITGSGGCIEDMQCDENGTLWIVNRDGYGYDGPCGLCRYTKEGGLDLFLENYDDSDIPILGKKWEICSLCLEIGPDGHVWIAPPGCLLEYDGETFHCYDTGIPKWQNPIRDLKFDDEGVLWCISTKGQLVSFDSETFVSHKVAEDDDRCECLDIDGSNIYIGTSKGLIVYNNGEQRNIELQTTVTTGINEHSAATSSVSSSVTYDLQGRSLSGKPEKGLYIQDGRKHTVR